VLQRYADQLPPHYYKNKEGYMSELSMNAVVSYNNGQLTAGDTNNCYIPWNWGYWDTHYHNYYTSYPVYQTSKIEQAFKIVAKLLEKKIIEKLTVKEFIELVGTISEIL
jgi:hypothetical protein